MPNHLRPGQASQTLQGWRLLVNYIGLQPHCNSVPTGQVKPSAFVHGPKGGWVKPKPTSTHTHGPQQRSGWSRLAGLWRGCRSLSSVHPSLFYPLHPPSLPSFPQSVIQQTYSGPSMCSASGSPSGWSHGARRRAWSSQTGFPRGAARVLVAARKGETSRVSVRMHQCRVVLERPQE